MAQTQQIRKPRAIWKDLNVDKTFLECCIHEVSMNGKEGGSLKPQSWKNVANILKTTHNFIVDHKQMRNHWDYLKGKYGAWLKLKNKIGNFYDPSTNTFNMTPEEWALEIEGNRYVESLRTTCLPFPELCAQLFEGSVGTGITSYGSSSKDPEPTMEPFVVVNTEEVETSSSKPPTSSTPCASSSGVKRNKRKAIQQSDVDEEILKFLKSVRHCHPQQS